MELLRAMRLLLIGFICTAFLAGLLLPAKAQVPEMPQAARTKIESILGTKGTYVPDEGAFKLRFPRRDILPRMRRQRGYSAFPAESWAAFGPAVHQESIVTAELSLLEDEVTPVIGAAVDSNLRIDGLANSTLGEGPRVFTLNMWASGDYDHLASGIRKCLNAISAVRRSAKANSGRLSKPALSDGNGIDSGPINTILSMNGTVTNGVYHAAIGRVTMLNGTPIGRELGASTWIAITGTNQHAIIEGEFAATESELQPVLNALRSRNFKFISIRNHTLGEHPQLIFVRYTGDGPAVKLAEAVRHVLNIQVGVVEPHA